jgi:hypothetical protein
VIYNAHLRGKIQLAKIGERSEQKANCILSRLKFLLCVYCTQGQVLQLKELPPLSKPQAIMISVLGSTS